MRSTRVWALGGVGVAALVLLAGWFLLVSPKRGEAADLRAQNEQQLTENASLRAQLATLRRQAQQLPAQRARLAELAEALPDNPKLPSLIRTLTATAAYANADLTNIAPGAPTVVGAAPGGSPSQGEAAPPGGGGGTPQLQSVPLSLTVSGTYADVETFLSRLEEVNRSFVVTGFTLGRNEGGAAEGDTTGGTTGTAPTGEASAGRGPIRIDLTGQVFMVSDDPLPTTAGATPAPATPPSGTSGGG